MSLNNPYTYPPPTTDPSSSSHYPLPAIPPDSPHQPALPHRDTGHHSTTYQSAPDTEPEGDTTEPQGPPKKKRRRQALSCTECKRRKIKCDRNQPCGPCSRRGEQQKCQWHIVEPVEKYVSRTEFDQLKTRLERLESFVNQMWASSPAPPSISMSPSYPMSMQQTMTTPTASSPVHSYQPSGSVPAVVYNPNPIMTSPSFPTHSVDPAPMSPSHHRYPKPGSPHSPRHLHPHHHQPSSSPSTSISHSHHHTLSASPIMQTHPLSMNRGLRPGISDLKSPSLSSPTPAGPSTSKHHSPLSLASITSPFNPDPRHHAQPKNSPAQTFTLGERLRPVLSVPADPATPSTVVHPPNNTNSTNNTNTISTSTTKLTQARVPQRQTHPTPPKCTSTRTRRPNPNRRLSRSHPRLRLPTRAGTANRSRLSFCPFSPLRRCPPRTSVTG